MKKSFRLVVCLDVDAENLSKAYGVISKFMSDSESYGVAWESSDESYGPDGEPIDEAELQKARMSFYKTLHFLP